MNNLNQFEATPDDPWYVDPKDTKSVMDMVVAHLKGSHSCTHGNGFTYDFCPIANGILDKANKHLQNGVIETTEKHIRLPTWEEIDADYDYMDNR